MITVSPIVKAKILESLNNPDYERMRNMSWEDHFTKYPNWKEYLPLKFRTFTTTHIDRHGIGYTVTYEQELYFNESSQEIICRSTEIQNTLRDLKITSTT